MIFKYSSYLLTLSLTIFINLNSNSYTICSKPNHQQQQQKQQQEGSKLIKEEKHSIKIKIDTKNITNNLEGNTRWEINYILQATLHSF